MRIEVIDGEHRGTLVEFDGLLTIGDSFRHHELRGWHRIVDFDSIGRGLAEQVTPLTGLESLTRTAPINSQPD